MGSVLLGSRGRRGAVMLAAAAVAVAAAVGPGGGPVAVVRADSPTISGNVLRDGWDANEPELSPAVVSKYLGRLWTRTLPNAPQVYAQPLVVGGKVIVATESDEVYALSEADGSVLWHTTIGTPEPSGKGQPIPCGDLTPQVGVTATPVADPSTGRVYVSYRTWDGSTPASGHTEVTALDLGTGQPLPGWPVSIQGTATNDSTRSFDPVTHNQRPGLLLLAGRVWLAFASFCDNPTYAGWVAGVDTATHGVTLWTDEAGSAVSGNPNPRGGIWQSGGGIASDAPDSLLVVSGNGVTPSTPDPGGSQTPPVLANSAIRLRVQPDGTLVATDHFTPHDAQQMNSDDLDFGSGGPSLLPPEFPLPADVAAAHPHLLLSGGKNGVLYLLDRDHLGGFPGSGGSDPAVAEVQFAPSSGGDFFARAAVWPGDGGYAYLPDVDGCGISTCFQPGALRAYHVDSAGSNGSATLRVAGQSADVTRFGTGSPVVSSFGTRPGSAVVWLLQRYVPGQTTAELRAYAAVPDANKTLQLLFRDGLGPDPSTPGHNTKFSMPAVSDGRVVVATRDGVVLCDGPTAPTAYRFGASPLASPATLAAGQVVTTTVTAVDAAGAPVTGAAVQLSFTGVGTATASDAAGPRPLSGTPQVFIADGNGQVGIAYTPATSPPPGAVDVITAAEPNYPLTPVSTSYGYTRLGYWLVAADGGVFSFGDAAFYGSMGGRRLNAPVVGMAATPDGRGYWLVAADGGVFSFGDAAFYGSMGGRRLNAPVVGMAATPDGGGYWLVAADGGVFSFGDAAFYGSMGGRRLNAPVVGMAATPDGRGYWLVAADGGVFAFGDAAFYGSMGGRRLNAPVVGMAATPDGGGYWLVAADGGVFSFGAAAFSGSTGGHPLNAPVVGMAALPQGYWLVAGDGGVFSFGAAAFSGSMGGHPLNAPVVGMAPT